MGHDLIVIGASAGGIEALSEIAATLPADLPACICVVQHLAPSWPSLLPQILAKAGRLPVAFGADGDPLVHGRIYLAPPDRHLVVERGALRLTNGPKENNFRPAVDPLFRSAARERGPRAVGVVLTGALDCGTAGLVAIKGRGGVTVVQDPSEAVCSDMPVSAIENVEVDYIVRISELGALLAELASARAAPSDEPTRSKPLAVTALTEIAATTAQPFTGLICPSCTGPLYDVSEGQELQFRCRVGHAFGPEGLGAEQRVAVEGAFWAALRALEDHAALARRLATRANERGHAQTSERFSDRALHAEHQARIVREQLLGALARPAPPDE